MPPILPLRKPDSPALRTHKKPISGRPAIGAQFVSFNFPNTLICGPASSDTNASATAPTMSPRLPTDQRKTIFSSPQGCTPRLFSCKQQEKEQAAAPGAAIPGRIWFSPGRASKSCRGGGSRTRKNPVRFPARGTLREFQFREYSDLRSDVNTLFSTAGAKLARNIFRLAPGQMPESGMLLSPMLRILRRRLI
jgi:hypothetical protein